MCDWKDKLLAPVDPAELMEQYASDEAVSAYLKEICQYKPLPTDVEDELARQVVAGDRDAKDSLIAANLGLVVAIAMTYQDQGLIPLDLIQEGNIGLFRAMDTFQPEAGYSFSHYAQLCIHDTIQRELATMNQTLRIPPETIQQINSIYRCIQNLRQELEREPDVEEIAQALHLPVEEIREAVPVADVTPTEPDRERLQEILDRLTPREAAVIRMRFGLEDGQTHTVEEVAQAFGVARERIRQIERKALRPCRAKRRKPIRDFYN